MRIALVIGNYDAAGGGAERWTDQHARMLLDAGHEVHLVARRFRGAPDTATCHVIDDGGAKFRRRLRFGRLAESVLRELKADVVHDMGDGWFADVFMPHHGTREGSFNHNTNFLPPLARIGRRLAYLLFPRYVEFRMLEHRQYDPRHSPVYLAVSGMIRRHMQQYQGVPTDRIRVIYNGVDTERFQPVRNGTERATVRNHLGIKDNETLFLIVAHNFRLKGLDTLLRSLHQVNQASQQARLVVVGDGPVGRYQAIARACDCAHAVRFVGDQPDPLPYYRAADVFVLPTFYDPCSLVVLEAMAMGMPIITSQMNGVHELMESGREGIVIEDPTNADELAVAMVRYFDPDSRRRAGTAARELAERHSVQHMFEQHLATYADVVSAGADRG